MKGRTVGIMLMVVSACALGVGGYFLYKGVNNGASNDNNIQNVEGSKIKFIEDGTLADTVQLESNDLRFTYDDLATKGKEMGLVPSKGDVNVFVVPVEFPDYKGWTDYRFNAGNLSRLNSLFNGDKLDGTNSYYESVSSFYKKSSYGQLNLNFTITDILTPSITSNEFVDLEKKVRPEAQGTYHIVEDFYKYGKIDGQPIDFNNPIYDKNNDGHVDGVWFVYNNDKQSKEEKDKFWPYVFWYQSNDINFPISAYANCSVAFSYDASRAGNDAHTFIHETGHLLGLDDYYTYDLVQNRQIISAMGGLDMMDFNIGDHNAYSKTALGWTKPIIPTSNGEIFLKPFQESGDCIILGNKLNGSAFSEYLILEYFTPTGLNAFDGKYKYPTRPKYFNDYGIRLFHIDARLVKITMNDNLNLYGEYASDNLQSIPENRYYDTLKAKDFIAYKVGHSNTRSRNIIAPNSNEDLIALISQDHTKHYNGNVATNGALFQDNEIFCYADYKEYFPHRKFNDGSQNNFSFKVLEMKKDGCRITVNI